MFRFLPSKNNKSIIDTFIFNFLYIYKKIDIKIICLYITYYVKNEEII